MAGRALNLVVLGMVACRALNLMMGRGLDLMVLRVGGRLDLMMVMQGRLNLMMMCWRLNLIPWSRAGRYQVLLLLGKFCGGHFAGRLATSLLLYCYLVVGRENYVLWLLRATQLLAARRLLRLDQHLWRGLLCCHKKLR